VDFPEGDVVKRFTAADLLAFAVIAGVVVWLLLGVVIP
jgi:hypothetical protein